VAIFRRWPQPVFRRRQDSTAVKQGTARHLGGRKLGRPRRCVQRWENPASLWPVWALPSDPFAPSAVSRCGFAQTVARTARGQSAPLRSLAALRSSAALRPARGLG
jgi:hypothetical protein